LTVASLGARIARSGGGMCIPRFGCLPGIEKKKPEKIMNGSTHLPALAEWMMYGGGAVALVALFLAAMRNRAEARSGMLQTIAVLGIVVFLIGLVLAVQQGVVDIGGIR
jgi:hypothetical protein